MAATDGRRGARADLSVVRAPRVRVHGLLVAATIVALAPAGLVAYDAGRAGPYAAVGLGAMVLVLLVGWPVTGRILGRQLDPTSRDVLDDAGHELRTPITIMRGHLELLDPADPAELRATRALLLDELDRMSRLVDDLVALTKAGQPGFLHPETVDVGLLVDEAAGKARSLGDRDWRIDARANAYVTADRQRLTQALLQLAHNAVKHTAPGATVAFGSRVDSRTRTVHLWVRDTGPGVRPEDADRIFGRYQRAVQPARAPEGRGLGLAIVTAIARAHGGWVLLDRARGGGAVFTLVLPLARPSRRGQVPSTPPGTGRAAGHLAR